MTLPTDDATSNPEKGISGTFQGENIVCPFFFFDFMHHSISWCGRELAVVRLKQHVVNTQEDLLREINFLCVDVFFYRKQPSGMSWLFRNKSVEKRYSL